MNRGVSFFLKLAAFLLSATAAAKIFVALFSHTPVLSYLDPLFEIPFRQELFAVAGLEIVIATVCFCSDRIRLQLAIIAWFATNCAVYHLGLYLIGIHFCKCLGNIQDMFKISQSTANAITIVILSYLLLGAYGFLFLTWWKNRKPEAAQCD